MPPIVQEIAAGNTPESLAEQLVGEPGLVVLRSRLFESPQARYSFVAARPFLSFRSSGSRCRIADPGSRIAHRVLFGNPWRLLECLMERFELLDELDLPFPLGGCFGYWGYELKNFLEPQLLRRAPNDLDLPDCHLGFYNSLVAFDHQLAKTWIISTGLGADGARNEDRARQMLNFWQGKMQSAEGASRHPELSGEQDRSPGVDHARRIASNLTRARFLAAVERAQAYIRSGDIYQVNLSHRLTANPTRPKRGGRDPAPAKGRNIDTALRRAQACQDAWTLFQSLSAVSPAPFSAFLDCGEFQIASSSPELFLRLSGTHIQTRPIKGTRPRATEPTRDAQLAYELQTSPKELAELVMITDLLRNDLGKVCEFGSVQVPELVRLERFPQVQHLVSTVEGRLRPATTHCAAFAACFPGGSITGAPKFRAMQIIDELEPLSRGPYTGALGYLGFNRESQLSIVIRAALCQNGRAHFNVGAGIVADSNPAAEYEETWAKSRGFVAALGMITPERHPPRLETVHPSLATKGLGLSRRSQQVG
jgi:para-aminobenzoate synthetase component 1